LLPWVELQELSMPDWNTIVRDRIAPLRLEPAAECNLIEDLRSIWKIATTSTVAEEQPKKRRVKRPSRSWTICIRCGQN